jgi:uncharacterized protein YbjT (DUF2867 family)
MTNASKTILVLGGTGKTGSRVAAKLTKLGLSVRSAARNDQLRRVRPANRTGRA